MTLLSPVMNKVLEIIYFSSFSNRTLNSQKTDIFEHFTPANTVYLLGFESICWAERTRFEFESANSEIGFTVRASKYILTLSKVALYVSRVHSAHCCHLMSC